MVLVADEASVVAGVSVAAQPDAATAHRSDPRVVHAAEVAPVDLTVVLVHRHGRHAAREALTAEVVHQGQPARVPARQHVRGRLQRTVRKRRPQQTEALHPAANNAEPLRKTENRFGNSSQKTAP